MDGTNSSSQQLLFVHQQMFQVQLNEGPLTKLAVAIVMSVLFIWINCLLLFTLSRKQAFRETPRYVLFSHMLCNDSIQLLFTSLLYILSMSYLQIPRAACSLALFVSSATFLNAPLNLALMSLERYVAICFPLQHATIATPAATAVGILIIWFLGGVNVVIDILYAVARDGSFFSERMFCTRERIFMAPWQADVFQGFNAFYFVAVTLIIVFTYISVMVVARSASSNKESAKKAHRTLLLHLIQLGLCLNSFLYGIIERALAMTSSSRLFMDLRYLNYLFVLILPRCLSPLIYGLRDDAVRPLFLYYVRCGAQKVKPFVTAH
ncbi:odorant receptor 131-2-like [Clupea harengus]|uniref:Odorant receptor 131-2-like n=1 Tax=Clupea harengus TaxID=7950 RepID=A0A6P8FVP0_CLUHA|nr:odorant receptor 131-2-like [Clupea harengus]